MRSSTARATAIRRYISSRSSRDSPRSAPSSLVPALADVGLAGVLGCHRFLRAS